MNKEYKNKLSIDSKKVGISSWKGCCHWCHRSKSVAGKIGNDGLCDYCRENGRVVNR